MLLDAGFSGTWETMLSQPPHEIHKGLGHQQQQMPPMRLTGDFLPGCQEATGWLKKPAWSSPPQVCWGWMLEEGHEHACWLGCWLPLTEAGLNCSFPTGSKEVPDHSHVPLPRDSPSEEGCWLVANEYYCSTTLPRQNPTGEPSACPCWRL